MRTILLIISLLSTLALASTEDESSSLKIENPNFKNESLQSISLELELIKKQLEESSEDTGHAFNQANEKSRLEILLIRDELQKIEGLLNNYKRDISDLELNGVNESLGMNFSVWTGILLTCVAVIVTTLGVVIAIGSVFGYKKIMDSSRQEANKVAKNIAEEEANKVAKKIAEEEANKVAKKIAEEEANKVAKEEIAKRIDRGEFNALVIEAVDRVAFGNINSNILLNDDKE